MCVRCARLRELRGDGVGFRLFFYDEVLFLWAGMI